MPCMVELRLEPRAGYSLLLLFCSEKLLRLGSSETAKGMLMDWGWGVPSSIVLQATGPPQPVSALEGAVRKHQDFRVVGRHQMLESHEHQAKDLNVI